MADNVLLATTVIGKNLYLRNAHLLQSLSVIMH